MVLTTRCPANVQSPGAILARSVTVSLLLGVSDLDVSWDANRGMTFRRRSFFPCVESGSIREYQGVSESESGIKIRDGGIRGP